MSALDVRRLLEHLSNLMEAAGFKFVEFEHDDADNDHPSSDRLWLRSELYRGTAISLQGQFSASEDPKSGISIARNLLLRWPRAEKLLKELRPDASRLFVSQSSKFDPSEAVAYRRISKARRRIYPIAHISTKHVEFRFESIDEAMRSPKLDQAVNELREEIVPRFSAYCDLENLARMVIVPAKESYLHIHPMNVATTLAAAGRRRDFEAWREAYRLSRKDKQFTQSEELYLEALMRRVQF